MGRPIKKGSTDQSTVIRIIDSTDGTPENGVEHNTAGIDLWWRREQETKTVITEVALASLDAAHSDGGIELIGDGYYRLDLPDAAVAAGSGENSVQIGGTITGMIIIGNEHALVDYDPYDSVRAGLTALAGIAAGSSVVPAGYVGDYKKNGVVHFLWHTTVATSTDGTVKVYKNNGVDEVTVPTGITDTRDFDSKTGVHLCSVNLAANSFYAGNMDYLVVLSGAVISGVTIYTVIGTFSIEKRYQGLEWTKEG